MGSIGQYLKKKNTEPGSSKQEGIFLHYFRSQILPAYQTQLRSMRFFVSYLNVVVLILFWPNRASKHEGNEEVCFVPARNFCFCFSLFSFVFQSWSNLGLQWPVLNNRNSPSKTAT